MIQFYRDLPLGIRLTLMGVLTIFNLFLFTAIALSVMSAFYGVQTAMSILQGHFVTDADRYVFLFVQVIPHFGGFGLTALLAAYFETGFVVRRLSLGKLPAFRLIVIAFIGILAIQALVQLLVVLSQNIPLPGALKFLAEQGKEQEQIEQALMSGKSLLLFLAVTFVIAIEAAFAEEIFFRGLLLGALLRSKTNPVISIIVTGFLFSVVHVQFENFLSIWLLGCFLGYLYYISGSIWLSVIAHFANNFLMVFLKYLYNAGFIKTDIAEADIPLYIVIGLTVIFIICLYMLNKWRRPVDFAIELGEPELADNDEEHLDALH